MKFSKGFKSTNRSGAAPHTLPDHTTTTTQTAPPSLRPAQSTQNSGKTVTIEAKIDVGFGNGLFLRGEGQGLSWNQGIPLSCVDGSTWKWSGEAGDKLKFKLLLNDAVWAKGEDLVIRPGERVQVAPAF